MTNAQRIIAAVVRPAPRLAVAFKERAQLRLLHSDVELLSPIQALLQIEPAEKDAINHIGDF